MEKLNELLREYAQAIRRDDGTGFMHADAIRELFRARAASASQSVDERAAFKVAHPHLDLSEKPDAWNRPAFVHSHVDAMFAGWQARAASANETGAEGALGYAQRLATGLWEKHGRDSAPQWKVLDDMLGVLTQIDNMVCGLSRSPAMAAEAVATLHDDGYYVWNPKVAKPGGYDRAGWKMPVYAAPQPAQADARVALTDEQIAWQAARRTTTDRKVIVEEIAEMVDHMGEGRRLEEYVGAIREMKGGNR